MLKKFKLRANQQNETQHDINALQYVRRSKNMNLAEIIELLWDIDHQQE